MGFKEKIIERLTKVDDTKMYSVVEIVELGVIVNTNFESVDYKIYRVIKDGSLPAVNLGSEKMPRWVVEGRDLKAYCKKQYQLPE